MVLNIVSKLACTAVVLTITDNAGVPFTDNVRVRAFRLSFFSFLFNEKIPVEESVL